MHGMKCGCKACGKKYLSPQNPYKANGNFFTSKIKEVPKGLEKGGKKK